MNLRTRGLPMKCWQLVLPDTLHSVRSLLSTAKNSVPHERLFAFARRSSFGGSLPQWLCTPGPVLIKRFVRECKTDPLVDEVELLHANPEYAFIRYPNGREATVSLKHLAPAGATVEELGTKDGKCEEAGDGNNTGEPAECNEDTLSNDKDLCASPPMLRRSERVRRPPDRLTYQPSG